MEASEGHVRERALEGASAVERAAERRDYLPVLFLAGVLALYIAIGFLVYVLVASLI
jgi:hypothetical protein